MPKEKLQNLISNLHEHIGDDETSPEQQELLNQLNYHMHNWNEEEPELPSFLETVELLVEKAEEEHPKATAIAREILEVLNNIGV